MVDDNKINPEYVKSQEKKAYCLSEDKAEKEKIDLIAHKKEHGNVKLVKILGKTKGKEARAKYLVEYLKKKIFNNEKLDIRFNKDYPLKIADNEGNWIVLAPRVTNE